MFVAQMETEVKKLESEEIVISKSTWNLVELELKITSIRICGTNLAPESLLLESHSC